MAEVYPGKSSEKPTILWIHGAWHTPAHLEPMIELAKKAGYESECPRHPSVGSKPPLTMRDDANCIRDALSRLVDMEGRDILVVAHSYGGIVANEGIGSRFSRKERAAKGLSGGILRIVFVSAFVIPEGQSPLEAFGGSFPPFIPVDEEGMCHMLNPEQMFYHDLPPEEQVKWVAELLKTPAITQQAPLTQVVYTAHPVTYLHCTEDPGVTYEFQKSMVKAITDRYGTVFETDSLPSGHSPFLSMPEKTLVALERQMRLSAI